MTALPQPCAEPLCPGVIVLDDWQPFPSVAAIFAPHCTHYREHADPLAPPVAREMAVAA